MITMVSVFLVSVLIFVVLYSGVSIQYQQMSLQNVIYNLIDLKTELGGSCEYVKTIDREKSAIMGFQRRLRLTEDDMRPVQRNLRRMESDIGYLKSKADDGSRAKIQALEKRIRALEQKSQKNGNFKNTLENLERLVNNMEANDDAFSTIRPSNLEKPSLPTPTPACDCTPFIYFSAYRNFPIKNYEGHIGFEYLESNYGSAFNRFEGLFHVPIDGIYFFTFNAESDNEGLVVLTKNGQPVIRTIDLTTTSSRFKGRVEDKQLFIAQTIKLNRYDSVGCYTYDSKKLRGNDDYGWDVDAFIVKIISFQGYLLKAT